jgi:hypothetical protein
MITPEVAQAIRDHLTAGLAATTGALPLAHIQWPNQQFTRPVDADTKVVLPFAVVELHSGRDEQASIGAPGQNLFRSEGRLAVHVYVRKGAGDDVALQHCKIFRDLVRGQEVAVPGGMSIEFRNGRIPPGADGDDLGTYWRRSIDIDFRFDETA